MHVPSGVTLLPGSVLLLGLYQPVQDLDELVALKAGQLGGVKRGLQPVLHLAQQLLPHEGRVHRQDVGALAGTVAMKPSAASSV